MVSLNSWSVSVALYYVSVSGHSLSGELHSLRMSAHSLSVSMSELLEYRRKSLITCNPLDPGKLWSSNNRLKAIAIIMHGSM